MQGLDFQDPREIRLKRAKHCKLFVRKAAGGARRERYGLPRAVRERQRQPEVFGHALGTKLGQDWEFAGLRRTIEPNTKDAAAVNGRHGAVLHDLPIHLPAALGDRLALLP